MISIDESNRIEVSQYDTFLIRVNLHEYVLAPNDIVRFAIKQTTASSNVVFQKDYTNAGETYVDITIDKGELDSLEAETYMYDITLINKDTSKIQTLIWSAAFIIRGVAHNVE